jgi:hypothetical protein
MQTSKKISLKSNLRLIIVCLVIIVGGLFYWIYKSYLTNPDNVFYGMILNNLNTSSYVVVDEEQNPQSSITQQTLVESGSKDITISRETNNVIGSQDTIQTLSIGTPTTDYSSYQKIEVGKTSRVYNPIIGKWGVSSPEGVSSPGGQLYKSMVLTPFLFSSPSPNNTAKLMNFIKQNKVYSIKSSKLTSVNGKQAINYQIDIKLQPYSKLLDLYSGIIGYKNQLPTAQYSGNQVAQLEVTVATVSRQLIGLSYIGSSSIQIYESYGIHDQIKIPSKTIPLQTLKNEITALSKQ